MSFRYSRIVHRDICTFTLVFSHGKGVGEGGGQRGLVPPHFQKWGGTSGFEPPPTFDRPSVLI